MSQKLENEIIYKKDWYIQKLKNSLGFSFGEIWSNIIFLKTEIKLSEPSSAEKHENFVCERHGDVNTAAKSKTMVFFLVYLAVPEDPLEITHR